MDYDSVILGLLLLAACFLFGRYLSPHGSNVSDASRLHTHDDSAVNDVEQSPLAVAIKALIERNKLGETLAADTQAIPGQINWTRTVLGKTRSIRLGQPHSPQAEYILAYFEKDGDTLVDGKWRWDLELSVAAFARFLIEWEDWRAIANDNLEYLKKRVQREAENEAK
jgi:hypothetical protein